RGGRAARRAAPGGRDRVDRPLRAGKPRGHARGAERLCVVIARALRNADLERGPTPRRAARAAVRDGDERARAQAPPVEAAVEGERVRPGRDPAAADRRAADQLAPALLEDPDPEAAALAQRVPDAPADRRVDRPRAD